MKNILSLVVVFFLLTSISWGSNFGSSLDGKSANITFSHTSDLDSVHAWFGYDGDGSGADSANLYYWKKLLPCFGNDKIAMADNVALDSVGTHVLKIVYWPPDGSDSIATGIWLHENPNLIASDNIGINWGDITNKGTTNALNATTTKRSLDEYALLTGGASGLERIVANQSDIYTEVANIDAWNPITDNDSLIVDQSTMISGSSNWSADQRDSVIAALYAVTKDSVLVSIILEMLLLVKDTTDIQGSGGATDTTKIKACADNNPQIWTDQAGGAGSEQETLYVLDGDGNAVQGANVTWYNSTNTPYAQGETNVNGYNIFQIDPATYTVAVTQLGIHNILDTLTITADGRDTILVVAYGAGSSPGSDSICVEGWLFGEDGTEPKPGAKVIFSVQHSALMDTSTDPHILIEKFAKGVSATVSDSGHWRIYLPASINLVPWKTYKDGHWTSADTVFYNMKIERRTEGTIWDEFENIFIPDTTGCLNIEDIPFR